MTAHTKWERQVEKTTLENDKSNQVLAAVPSHSKTTVQREETDNLSNNSVNLRNHSYYRSLSLHTHAHACTHTAYTLISPIVSIDDLSSGI